MKNIKILTFILLLIVIIVIYFLSKDYDYNINFTCTFNKKRKSFPEIIRKCNLNKGETKLFVLKILI